MKHDYTALDRAIKTVLKTGDKKFRELVAHPEINQQSVRLATDHNAGITSKYDQKDEWRFVDQRLQWMRKKGVVEYGGRTVGWIIKE